MVQDIAKMKTDQAEALAAIRSSFAGPIDFLLHQTQFSEASPGSATALTFDPLTADIPLTWVAFDAAADATLEVTTSSTGSISYQCGGMLIAGSRYGATTIATIGMEVMDENGIQLRPPQNGDGNYSHVFVGTSELVRVANAGSGHMHRLDMMPHTTYVLRCRRGYQATPYSGITTGGAQVIFQGTALTVTKLGI
ncbi:hypothetical protein [Brooklawnia cerclae]|uniref:Uncharacterized protein n=1 Tax=Brooklawnia cerclae TaxID=349934 RepID=A0ABX0SKV8_9ACTN|nr:hypothetical protein [Brooklawnia cerclae]NIH57326.1 hypothetical protein [Brooklawnia cerclae]